MPARADIPGAQGALLVLRADHADRRGIECESGAGLRGELERHRDEHPGGVPVPEAQHVTARRRDPVEHAAGAAATRAMVSPPGTGPRQTVHPSNAPPRPRISDVVRPSSSP